MDGTDSNTVHDASAAALGFYYQSQYALLMLVRLKTDDAAVAIERLDDVEIKSNGQSLLYQLKHSIQENPPPVTLACVALWKTIKVWIDARHHLKSALVAHAGNSPVAGSWVSSMAEQNK